MNREQLEAELKTWEGVNRRITKELKIQLANMPAEKPKPKKVEVKKEKPKKKGFFKK
jgi:hypothetical protein